MFTDEVREKDLFVNDFVEIGVVVRGGGVFCIPDKTIPCKPGDAYIVPQGVAHGYFSAVSTELMTVRKLLFRVDKWFHGEFAVPDSNQYCYGVFKDGGEVACAVLNSSMTEQTSAILNSIERELIDKENGWETIVGTYLVQILYFLSRYIDRSLKNPNQKSKDCEYAFAAMKIVNKEFVNPELSLESIASRIYVSASKLSRAFKAQNGQFFSEYLRDIRFNYAAELLKNTDMTVEDIVLKCGISGKPLFFRNFRELFGMTPLTYRRFFRSSSKLINNNLNSNEEKRKKLWKFLIKFRIMSRSENRKLSQSLFSKRLTRE